MSRFKILLTIILYILLMGAIFSMTACQVGGVGL
jgi:hypothetical protein